MSIESDDVLKTMKLTDFKSDTIDISSEYSLESAVVEVSYEKVKDTVDFAGSIESTMIEVGTDTFGEKHISFIDTATVHDGKVKVEERLTSFVVSEMIDSESCFETKYMNESWSHDAKIVEVSSELFRGTKLIVDESSEWVIKTIESQVEQKTTTSDIGVGTEPIVIVEQTSEYELSCSTFDYDTNDMIEIPLEKVEEVPIEESVLERLEDECVSSEMTMIDIGTTITVELEDISTEMKVEHVEYSSEWSKDMKYESEIFETEKTVYLSTILSSDDKVEYCSVDIQFDEIKPNKVDTGYETTYDIKMMESHSVVEVKLLFNIHNFQN